MFFLGLLVFALARPRRRLGRQAGGQHAYCVVLRVMDTPALPFLLRGLTLAEPGHEIKGCAGRVSTGKVAGVMRRTTSARWRTAVATLVR